MLSSRFLPLGWANYMSHWWKTWAEVNHSARDRIVVLYGRSEDWLPKTLRRLRKKPNFIVDRDPGYAGTDYQGVPVEPPEKLWALDPDDVYVVVTAGEYEGIVTLLQERHFQAGADFACCPEYRDYALLETIRGYDRGVLIASSDYTDPTKVRYSRRGGGIFRYSTLTNTMEELARGSFRQLASGDGVVYAVEYVERELYKFDLDFNVLEKWPLDAPNYCGLAHVESRDLLVLVNSGKDTISIHDADSFQMLERIEYSDRTETNATSQHHLNDVCVSDDHMYVAYFSHSGTWKKGNYDGGVSEYSLNDLSRQPEKVVTGLWKPHSPEIIEGDLCYLDSMRGHLCTTNQVVAGEFHGFLRGLAHDGRFYFVGQSEDMYMSQRFGVAGNIMLNAGFYLFDKATRASRFYPLPDNMNVHDLLILER